MDTPTFEEIIFNRRLMHLMPAEALAAYRAALPPDRHSWWDGLPLAEQQWQVAIAARRERHLAAARHFAPQRPAGAMVNQGATFAADEVCACLAEPDGPAMLDAATGSAAAQEMAARWGFTWRRPNPAIMFDLVDERREGDYVLALVRGEQPGQLCVVAAWCPPRLVEAFGFGLLGAIGTTTTGRPDPTR